MALDGATNVWVGNGNSDGVSELLSGCSPTKCTAEIFAPPGSHFSEPGPLAVDESGNLWIVDSKQNSVIEFIGAAVPVTTPLKPGSPVLP